MPGIDQILHNIRDHIVTLRAVLERNEATGEARERLLRHMVLEEEDNQKKLADLLATAGPDQKRGLQIALDHSHFFCDIVKGKEISPELGKSLLEHLQEEHDQGLPGMAAPAPAPTGRTWTVGSLMGGK